MTRLPKTLAQWKDLAARQDEEIRTLKAALVKIITLTGDDPDHSPSYQLGAIRATAEGALKIEQ